MEMNMVLASFERLCESPLAWAILAGAAVHAATSLYIFLHCPTLRARSLEEAHADRAAITAPYFHSPRFLVTMLLGLALSIGGLYALRSPEAGPIAVGAILVGVYMLLSEPARRTVEENTRRVSAARLDGPEAYAFAHDRLRASHIERIATEWAVVGVLTVLILTM